MSPPDAGWSIRSLLSPVVARLLIFGVNPFDLERVLQRIERVPLRNARQLETRWLEEWEALAKAWLERGRAAVQQGRRPTALALGLQAVGCRLAQFLINGGDLARRRAIYLDYAETYRMLARQCEPALLPAEIPLDQGRALAAVLHLPRGSSPHPCVAVLSGLGSCKEEMHTLARMMVERGVAALVPDMPGCGESLFHGKITCGSGNLSSAFRGLADFVERRPELDASRFGATGLCMGGGYAYRACSEDSRYRFCATLFPLFIDQVDSSGTPQWMKAGEWFDLQTGGKRGEELLSDIGLRDSDRVACPFFLVHGKHDNWMTLDRALVLYDRATSPQRELLVIDDEPAYSSGQAITHAMPVGEQLCWVGPVVADWIARLAGLPSGSKQGAT